MVNDQTLRGELAEMNRRIRELKGARRSITYDLEQSLKEQDRLRRHLTPSPGEERMNIAKAEAGERELNAFIDRQAKRKGAEEANLLAMEWAASERRVLEKRREENRRAWISHYRNLTAAHLKIALDCRRRARAMARIGERAR